MLHGWLLWQLIHIRREREITKFLSDGEVSPVMTETSWRQGKCVKHLIIGLAVDLSFKHSSIWLCRFNSFASFSFQHQGTPGGQAGWLHTACRLNTFAWASILIDMHQVFLPLFCHSQCQVFLFFLLMPASCVSKRRVFLICTFCPFVRAHFNVYSLTMFSRVDNEQELALHVSRLFRIHRFLPVEKSFLMFSAQIHLPGCTSPWLSFCKFGHHPRSSP